MNKQEYQEWEQKQANKASDPIWTPQDHDDWDNYHSWRISRYETTPKTLYVTAKHTLGFLHREYVDRKRWGGGTEFENTQFEELHFHYVGLEQGSLTRTRIAEGLAFAEITQDNQPITGVLIVNSKQIWIGKPKSVKSGYSYTLKLL